MHVWQNQTKVIDDVTWIVPIVRCNVQLGLRAAELCNLSWREVDLNNGTIRITSGKSYHKRTVPFPDAVRELLLPLYEARQGDGDYVFKTAPKNGRLCSRYLSRKFKKYVRMMTDTLSKERIQRMNFHSTRHTAATWLIRDGLNPTYVQKFMGHSSYRVTERYVHLVEEHFVKEVQDVMGQIKFGSTDRVPTPISGEVEEALGN